VQLGVVRIAGSVPAPLLEVVVKPNDWQKLVRGATRNGGVSAKGEQYRAFWSRYLERVGTEHPDWTRAKVAPTKSWISAHGPIRGTSFEFTFPASGRLRSELYIDTGDGDENLAIFERLASQRIEIEEIYGSPLTWEDLPERQACRIADYGEGLIEESDRHHEFIDWFLDSGVRLRQAFAGQF
jgi:hypothetical protein